MKASYLDFLLIAIFFVTLIIAYFKKFNKEKLLADFDFGVKAILAFISIFISYHIVEKSGAIDKAISVLISLINKFIVSPAITAYIITIIIYGVSSYVIYSILKLILFVFRKFYLDNKLSKVEAKKSMKGQRKSGVSGVVLNITTAIAYSAIVAIIFMLLSIQNIVPIKGHSVFISSVMQDFTGATATTDANPFYFIRNKVENQDLISANSEVKAAADEENQVVVYYNGVTLAQAVKSDSAINNMAKQITQNDTTDIEKARSIYTWVGSNIKYDDAKANEITQNDGKGVKSGAIEAFNTREGVCFDYASLYVAMARAVGLEVRIVSGEGYTGTSWGPHAWNEVYIPSEQKWIPVDPTFESSGDYFATSNFYQTHRDGEIIGQWD